MNRLSKTILALAVLATLLVPGAGGAGESEREMKFLRRGDRILLSANFEEIFNQQLKRRLSSGFASRILVEATAVNSQNRPFFHGLVQITIIYDIWEEKFLVTMQEGESLRRLLLSDMEQVVKLCGSVKDMVLYAMQPGAAASSLRIKLQVTVNPAQAGLQEKVRQYLANPEGGRRLGAPRSFFGSFSKIFVSQQDFQADAIYNFRSPLKAVEE